MAKMRGGMRKHFCQEEKLDYVDDFISEPETRIEEAGFFAENNSQHLRGLKACEIEFLLTSRNKRKANSLLRNNPSP